MIVEPAVCVLLHCSRCNTVLKDSETETEIHWQGQDDIKENFGKFGDDLDSYGGFRRFGDRYICEDCQTTDDDGNWRERPEPLTGTDEAKVLHAQLRYRATENEQSATEVVRALLDVHRSEPFYRHAVAQSAESKGCGCVSPSDAHWDKGHPEGTGPGGESRICLKQIVGSYCPGCADLAAEWDCFEAPKDYPPDKCPILAAAEEGPRHAQSGTQAEAANTLRYAARKLRQHASAVAPGPWKFLEDLYWDRDAIVSHGRGVQGWDHLVLDVHEGSQKPAGDYMALMHPGVAKTVAAVLEQAADTYSDQAVGTVARELAIANAILGAEQKPAEVTT